MRSLPIPGFDARFFFVLIAECQVPAPKPQAEGHEPCEEFVPGLRALPWHDTSSFEWVQGLEARAGEIQAELSAALEGDPSSFNGDSALQTEVMGRGWSALRLQRLGKWNEQNTARFPKTTALIRELGIPTAVRGVMFARQRPGSAVARHSDGRNFVLTCHLGLRVPPGGASTCWIDVAGQRKGWEEGKALILDTSFWHATSNESAEDRHVLIIDFFHPDLTKVECEALKFIYDLRYEYDSGLMTSPQKGPLG